MLIIGNLYLCSVIYFLSLFDKSFSPQQPGRKPLIVALSFFWFLIPILMFLGIIQIKSED